MTRKEKLVIEPNRFYRKAEVAHLLGVCARTVSNWIKAGKLQATPYGRIRGDWIHKAKQ